ncbi:uncharacterized protein LOC118404815 [Branchiostoma floridae]|uniref:Uncharacterized protein LOC118404815 n=1 Tax=Branchiostoma floridae TaxID=7739 RepID=A0A9J7HKJ0_BRAFL|nr:uncharacterized protein LOC118404815 [Branchiostoma floridae]XP_035660065.1 uncharacterized protein LOC118404815 [Branchiostoma floridae]
MATRNGKAFWFSARLKVLCLLLMFFACGRSLGEDQRLYVSCGGVLTLSFNATDTNDVFLVKWVPGKMITLLHLVHWDAWTAGSVPTDVEINPALEGRVEWTYDPATNNFTVLIDDFQHSDTGPGVWYEFQQSRRKSPKFYPIIRDRPDPPTHIKIHGVRLYSFELSCTAGNRCDLAQTLCLKHLGKNHSISCREDVHRGEEVQFHVAGLNHSTQYQLCVYAVNQLGSSGCGQASAVMVTTEAIGQFYADLRLLNVPFVSSDPNDERNRELVNRINKTLSDLLQPSHPDLTVEVTEMREGSVIVTVHFKGVLKEMDTIRGKLRKAVTGGDLAHIGVDRHYFYTFDHRGAETTTAVWISILVAVVIIVALAAVVLLAYCKWKKRTKEVVEEVHQSLTNVPEPTPYFESEDFKNLSKEMAGSNICIVHGQLGIGKSHAVAKFVEQGQAKTKSYVTWFIGYTNDFSDTITNNKTGLSKETVSEKLLELVKELKDSGRPVDVKQGEKDVTKICKALKDSKTKCLLVFDDVQDISVIPRQFLTPWSEITVLITTMDETLGTQSNFPQIPRLKMNGFSPSDVESFLTSGNSDNVFTTTSKALLKELATQFAFLPLGLSLAKGHILDSNTSVQEYLNHLQQQRTAMGRGNGNLSEPERNIFAAVQLLLIHRMDKVPRQVLQLMAFLMPNNVPTAILMEAYWHLSGRGLNVDEFIKAVRKLSLIQVAEDKKTEMRMLTIHQLTQRAVFDMLKKEDQLEDKMIQALVKAFLVLFIKDTRQTRMGAFVSHLLPHLLSLLRHPSLSIEKVLSMDDSNHPLLTALIRLYEVLCYMYCQQRRPDQANSAAEKAKALCNHLCKDLPSQDITKVYDMLKNLGLDRFQEDVYGNTVTRQLIASSNIDDVLKSKVPKDVTKTLDLMAKSFQPLSEELYSGLVRYGVALSTEQIKASYLIELVVSVFYTTGRILFYLHGDRRKEYFATASNDLYFSHNLSKKFSSHTQVHLLNEMLSNRAGILYLLKEKSNVPQDQKNDLLEVIAGYNELINDSNDYFEYGILKKVQQDNFHAMFCYRSIVDSYKKLAKLASSSEERKTFIRDHNTNAEKMIEYAEKQGTRNQQGRVIDGLELLPEVYNMRAQFIIDMYAAGFKDDLPEDDSLQNAAQWAHHALGVESCKPLHKAKANLLLASAFVMAYEHREVLSPDHEEDPKEEHLEVIDEREQLLPKSESDSSDVLTQADEYLKKSIEIYKEIPNATSDIGKANSLVEKLQKYKEETKNQAQHSARGMPDKPNQAVVTIEDGSLNRQGKRGDVEEIEMGIMKDSIA